MRFTQDSALGQNIVRAHAPGRLQINETVFNTAVIVSPTALLPAPGIAGAEELRAEHAPALLDLDPQVVLIGTGVRQVFAPRDFCAAFLSRGIGVEAMSSAAACRTFNVLVSERRRVVALLWP